MTGPRIGSLCTGYGGLDMAAQAVFGGTVVWHAEHEPDPPAGELKKRPAKARNAAARLLAHRFPLVPNHGDITAMDWASAAPVDILTAGWPCQPWSTAGHRKGERDERAIWPEIARAVRDLRPRVIVLENVPRVVAAGELGRVAADLDAVGYVGAWRCLRAADVGAPHRRDRVFIVAADTDRDGRPGWRPDRARTTDARWAGPRATIAGCGPLSADPGGGAVRYQPEPQPGGGGAAIAGPDHGATAHAADVRHQRRREPRRRRPGSPHSGHPAVADTQSDGRREGWPEPTGLIGGCDVARGGHVASHPDGTGGETRPPGAVGNPPDGRCQPVDSGHQDWGRYGPAIDRWAIIIGRPAPAPTVVGRRGHRQLNPPFVEWLMGVPAGWVCDTPGLTRNDQLRVLGNGVVPQQGAAAVRWLAARLPLTTGGAA